MVEAAYRHQGLHWHHINCEVHPGGLADALRGARALEWRGFNCSIPHKVAVIAHLAGLGESARIIGAVNIGHFAIPPGTDIAIDATSIGLYPNVTHPTFI